MKSAIIVLCVVASAYATSVDEAAQVLRQAFDINPDGSYSYGYETDNGIQGQAQAQLKSYGKDEVALEVTGSNAFKSPEGQIYQVDYIANENGYQPQGAHLPTPPPAEPIPEYIARAIAYIAAHPYQEKKV